MNPLALLALSAACAAALPPPQVAVLPGGLELIVAPDARADTASLRYVVRSGGARDPAGKEGLAHLLEHLLVRDAPGESGLVDAARVAGANLNAFTARDWTTYVLDAPAAEFDALAETYLRAITNPAFRPSSIDRELGVIRSEAEHAQGGELVGYVEDTLFREGAPEGTTLGETRSREEIGRADVLEFFQRHYATSNTTLIFTGAVTDASVRALLDRAFLLPPALPEERVPPRADAPSLPLTEKLRAPFIAAVSGFRLDPADRDACEPLASLVELRLLYTLQIREHLVLSVSAGCYTFRGADFLLATVYAPTLHASDLPQTIDRVFEGVGRRAANARERLILEKRLARQHERVAGDPAALADLLGRAAAHPRDGERSPVPALETRRLAAERVRDVARRAFTPERRLHLLLTPFEG